MADLRRIAAEARERLGAHGEPGTLLFVDEIHRFNMAQQDVILPYVEDGTFALIGATTENPSFEVVSPLLSRARVFALDPLTDDEVGGIAEAALADRERGLGDLNAALDEDALAASGQPVQRRRPLGAQRAGACGVRHATGRGWRAARNAAGGRGGDAASAR